VRAIPAAIVAAVLVGAAACTSSPTAGPEPASPPATATPGDSRPTPSSTLCGWGARLATDVPGYRGMTLVAAKDRAVSAGLTVRELGADGVCFSHADDNRQIRMNFYLERGVVVWAQLH
jgi:hypothetical protein